jgi:hypothetical protein
MDRVDAEALTVTFPDVAVATTSSADVGTMPSAHVLVEFQLPPALEMVRVAANAGVYKTTKRARAKLIRRPTPRTAG